MYKELNSAREAFQYVLEYYRINKIHIPYYLCDVMRHTAYKTGCKIEFYHIDDNFLPDIDFSKTSFILYPNYFGICDSNIELLSKEYPNLIVDNAHAYFNKPKGLACFNSHKKFLQTNLGSDLWFEDYDDTRNLDKQIQLAKKQNFSHWHNLLLRKNQIIITNYNSPFCYPYLAESVEIADNFVNNTNLNIYRYWNQLPKAYNEYKFYSRLVPIPI